MMTLRIMNTDEEIKVIKEILLNCLQNDKEIKDLIKNICSGNGESSFIKTEKEGEGLEKEIPGSINKTIGEDNSEPKEINELKSIISEKENVIKDKNAEINKITSEMDNKQGRINELEDKISEKENVIKDKNAEINKIASERDNKQGKINELEDIISKKDNVIKDKEVEINKITSERDNKQDEINKLNLKLRQRFDEGWSLYQVIEEAVDDRKDKLSSCMKCSSLASFICSGAQLQNLEFIWDEALKAKRNNEEYADLFWRIFVYCTKLVNLAREQELIVILEPKLGDRFNSEIHSTTGTNSTAQGEVRDIILPGYRNTFKKEIKRKSNVVIG